MVSSQVHPNVLTYNALLSACGRAQHWERVLVLLGDMRASRKAAPNQESYFVVLLALAAAGRFEHAQELYRAAVDIGDLRPWHRREPGVIDLHNFPAEVAKIA